MAMRSEGLYREGGERHLSAQQQIQVVQRTDDEVSKPREVQWGYRTKSLGNGTGEFRLDPTR